jgi:hypothetical protein
VVRTGVAVMDIMIGPERRTAHGHLVKIRQAGL